MRHVLSLLAMACALTMSAAARAGEWMVPPASYAYAPSQACEDGADKAGKTLRPNQATYRVCEDQMAVLAAAMATARASNKLLLVTFGATWCPWCANLQRQMPTKEVLAHQGDAIDLGRTFHHAEIGLSTLHKGQKASIPSGDAVLATVLQHAPGVKIRVIPFVAVIDPGSTDRVYARNIDDIMRKDGGIDLAALRALLVEAHNHVRQGVRASDEPNWLRRKWQRIWKG